MSNLPSGDTVAVPLLLSRAAMELSLCTQMLARVEALILAMMSAGADGRAASVSAAVDLSPIQDIDLLCQCLADIGRCLSSLASDPAIQRADPVDMRMALGRLKLADLRARLAGKPTPVRTVDAAIELFGP